MRLHICPLALTNSSLPRLNAADYPASRPPLAFSGSSLSQGFQVGVYGQVAYEKDGHLHWRFVVYYGGADRWRLEGIQVHEGARMGIIGVWSPAEGDPRGPVGPFWSAIRALDQRLADSRRTGIGRPTRTLAKTRTPRSRSCEENQVRGPMRWSPKVLYRAKAAA